MRRPTLFQICLALVACLALGLAVGKPSANGQAPQSAGNFEVKEIRSEPPENDPPVLSTSTFDATVTANDAAFIKSPQDSVEVTRLKGQNHELKTQIRELEKQLNAHKGLSGAVFSLRKFQGWHGEFIVIHNHGDQLTGVTLAKIVAALNTPEVKKAIQAEVDK